MWHVSKSYFKSSIDVNYKGALLINLIKVWQKATFRSKSCFEINNFEFYHFWHEKFKHSRLLTSKIPKFWLFWKENYEDSPIMIFRNFEQQAVNCVSGWHREIRRGIPFWITFEARLNHVWITFESRLNHVWITINTIISVYSNFLSKVWTLNVLILDRFCFVNLGRHVTLRKYQKLQLFALFGNYRPKWSIFGWNFEKHLTTSLVSNINTHYVYEPYINAIER